MSNFPRISIVTPSFNQGQFIEKTITSILDQGYPELEYIIIDGGSTDNSVEIIKKYEKHLSYWISEPDRGQSHAINKGIAHCTGQIFNWINSDDYLEKGALFHVAEAWQEDKNAAAWVGATNRLHSNGFLHYISYPNGLWLDHLSLTIPSHCVYQPSCFFNMKDVQDIGGVVENLHYSMDLDLYIKLLSKKYFKKGKGIWSTAVAHLDAKTVKEVKKSNIEKSNYYKEIEMNEASKAAIKRAENIFFYTMPSCLRKKMNALLVQKKIDKHTLTIPFSFDKRNTVVLYCAEKKLSQNFLNFLGSCLEKILCRFPNIHFQIIHPEAKNITDSIQLENIQCKTNLPRDMKQIKVCICPDNSQHINLVPFIFSGVPVVAHPNRTEQLGLEDGESCFSAINDYDMIFKAILILLDCSVWGNISTNSLLNAYTKNLELQKTIPIQSSKRILFYFFKNVHLPILLPLYKALQKELASLPEKNIEIGFSYLPPAPQIRAGLNESELQTLRAFQVPVYSTPQEFEPDLTFIADSVYPWVQGCGKLVHVGHGVLSKGQYYTDTAIARREEEADLICVPGKHHQAIMRRILSKPVVATGMCKLDDLFAGKISREKVLQRYNLPDKRYVLFAPTFNDELSSIPCVGDKIGEVLPDDDTLLVIKLHPSSKPEYKKMYSQLPGKNSRIIYADELDITPFLALCSVMISDVSSAMMEFAALDKPLILFNNPKWKEYPNYNPQDIEFQWRDIGLQVSNLEEMKKAVAQCLQNPASLSEKRQHYTDLLFANKKYGNAAERIVKLALSMLNA